MQNAGKLVKTIAQMQARMSSIQKELAATEYVGTSGGGLVKMSLRGDGEMTNLVLDKEVLSEEPQTAAELVMAAYSAALKAKEADSKEKLKSVSAGLLPTGFSLPFGA